MKIAGLSVGLNAPTLIGAAVVLFLANSLIKQATGKSLFNGLGSALGGGAVDLAGGVVEGVGYGVGDAVGVPRTDIDECAKARADGRLWDASFSCPAGDFLGEIWRRRPSLLGGT